VCDGNLFPQLLWLSLPPFGTPRHRPIRLFIERPETPNLFPTPGRLVKVFSFLFGRWPASLFFSFPSSFERAPPADSTCFDTVLSARWLAVEVPVYRSVALTRWLVQSFCSFFLQTLTASVGLLVSRAASLI